MLLENIPADVVAEATLGALDARDLLALDGALGGRLHTLLPPHRPRCFTTARSLSSAERAWFAARDISVVTRVQQAIDYDNFRDFSPNPWSDNFYPGDNKILVLAFPVVCWKTLGDNVIHRDDGAAVESLSDGTRIWVRDGFVHRVGDLPAMELANGGRAWFCEGELHRVGDRPALIRACGTKEWWRHGKRHRAGYRPAVERANGQREFWYRGERVRITEDGSFSLPARRRRRRVVRRVGRTRKVRFE